MYYMLNRVEKMKKYNDFERICKCLNIYKKAEVDIDHVMLNLVMEISGNRNKFLKLKAECEAGDFMTMASFIISMGAIYLSIYTSLLAYEQSLNKGEDTKGVFIETKNITIEIAKEVSTKGNVFDYIYNLMNSNNFKFMIFFGFLGATGYILKKLYDYTYVFKWKKYVLVCLEELEKEWNDYFPDSSYKSK